MCVFVNPVLIPFSANGRVDHFHPTRYLSHLPAGIFYCMPLRKIVTQWNFLYLWNKIIGHFRVPKTLTFKMRLGAQPFLFKWILFSWEWKMISISNVEPLPSFWNLERPGELGNGLFGRLHWGTINFFSVKKRPNISLYVEYSRTLTWFFEDFKKFAYNTT